MINKDTFLYPPFWLDKQEYVKIISEINHIYYVHYDKKLLLHIHHKY